MIFWTRAAALAALACMMTGMLATSTPGAAAEVAQAAQVALGGNNTLTPLQVPSLPQDDAVTGSDVPGYTSLDAAVAAQDAAAEDQAIRCLAGAIYYESKGEPLAGQLAVAEVVLNRSKSGRFPPDVCGVVLQRGQFGFVRDGSIPPVDQDRPAWKRAVAVAKVAMADAWNSAASEALYFNALRRAPGRAIRVAAIGNHTFYR